jgi:flavin-dependent dehydrogenase
MRSNPITTDVLVIGAGPSGAIAAANLHRLGHRVLVLERETFPRFSIGESLLPHCMSFVEEAGMLDAVNGYGFQFKNGAAFRHKDRYAWYDFEDKFSPGPGTTFQVDRAQFDKLLADQAALQGVEIRYRHTITQVNMEGPLARADFTDADGNTGTVECRFILDASGFGRVLPRLLELEAPSNFPVRQAVFTHVDDHIEKGEFDRNKILVTVHPEERDIWYWLIPFSDGRCSLGVVATREKIALRKEETLVAQLQRFVAEAPELHHLLRNAQYNYPSREIVGYAAKVKTLAGDKFALLGNAGEFLDPVFSSGVTIAMRSASTATKVLDRQLRGETVDWQGEYAEPLRRGIETFRVFVEAWYDGRFQDIIFYPNQTPQVRRMISSILAGYAWDEDNPFVDAPLRRMNALADFCRQQMA